MSRVAVAPPPLEYQEAIWFNDWRQTMVGQEPRLAWLHHTPNGELRDKRIAAKLKAMGVLPGVVDYCLPVPCRGHHGLWLELKRAGIAAPRLWAACTPAEQAFLRAVIADGYAGVVASGWVHAAQLVCEYLGRPELAP